MTLFEKGMNAVKRGQHHAKIGERQIEKAERECNIPKAIANDNKK